MLADDTCYRALEAKDARFDGVFFVGVSTTGIYCRPICRARTPRSDRCSFWRSGAEAERAGFRACLRCRPELAPGNAPVDSISRIARRVLSRVEEVAMGELSIAALARELEISERHLRRACEVELGVAPMELVTSRRLAMAKQLLHDTQLGLAAIAFASGFGSVRRFNHAFRARFNRPPSSLRKEIVSAPANGTIALRLGYRQPFAFHELLGFLCRHAVPGVETVIGSTYARTVRVGERVGVISVRDDPAHSSLVAEVPLSLAEAVMPISARLRALFDLDADPMHIEESLRRDRRLRASLRKRAGLRVPGAFCGFELGVGAIVGQQVSVAGARTLGGRLCQRFGETFDGARHGEFDACARVFPDARTLADASEQDISSLGILPARARTLIAFAQGVCDGHVRLDRSADVGATIDALERVPGIGAWTAQYIAMRALRWPDAFPSSDLALRRMLDAKTPREAEACAEAWRPWRAYAAMHLFCEYAEAK